MNCRNLRARPNTHHPQFCTCDVDRRFCGGGPWILRSDVFKLTTIGLLVGMRATSASRSLTRAQV